MTEELQTAEGQLDLDTLAKIITAYAINSDPAFIAHAVFGSAEPQQMDVVLKQINSEEFLAIAEASKFQSSMDTPQTLKQVKASYKVMAAEFRNKFCRDMLKKINSSDEADTTMELKSATAAPLSSKSQGMSGITHDYPLWLVRPPKHTPQINLFLQYVEYATLCMMSAFCEDNRESIQYPISR